MRRSWKAVALSLIPTGLVALSASCGGIKIPPINLPSCAGVKCPTGEVCVIGPNLQPKCVLDTQPPTPVPTPTPTPPPAGVCPFPGGPNGASLSHVGIVQFGPPIDVKTQGGKYLGKRYNYDTTNHSKGAEYCQYHRPGQGQCDQLLACQDPEGPQIVMTLPGHFANDRCDKFSDNPAKCHHKPEGPNGESGKGAQVGVTVVCASPQGDPLPDVDKLVVVPNTRGPQWMDPNVPRARCVKTDVR